MLVRGLCLPGGLCLPSGIRYTSASFACFDVERRRSTDILRDAHLALTELPTLCFLSNDFVVP